MLFEIKDVDKKFYNERLRDFLPDKIIDSHSHIWLDSIANIGSKEASKIQSWPLKVAKDDSIEDLLEAYRLFFPDKDVSPFFCGAAINKDGLEKMNEYCSLCAKEYGFFAFGLAHPDWDAEQFESAMKRGGFLGAKVYLTFAPDYIPTDEIRIFDFLPHHQLEVLNKNGWAALLHIARPGRLGDPLNLAQMLEIEQRYPNVKLIIAHVGRAYCPEDVGNAFEILKNTKNMVFDLAANTNADVFEQLINAVGPKRILFGSDEPISRMRMKRICENGRYINLVAKGAYGDVSNDPHMREVSKEQSDKFTFFMYEIIDAFRRAAERTGLSQADIEDVFHNNAHNLIESTKPKPSQLQMVWPKNKINKPLKWTLPKGYSLRTYQSGDDGEYIRVMKLAGFKKIWPQFIVDTLKQAVPNGLFFVVHNETKQIVVTAAALHRDYKKAEFGWLAGDPAHKGRQLGYIVSAAAVKCLLDAGYSVIYLKTDDFRLPAIRTYLKLGFEPHYTDDDHKQRWISVLNRLESEAKPCPNR